MTGQQNCKSSALETANIFEVKLQTGYSPYFNRKWLFPSAFYSQAKEKKQIKLSVLYWLHKKTEKRAVPICAENEAYGSPILLDCTEYAVLIVTNCYYLILNSSFTTYSNTTKSARTCAISTHLYQSGTISITSVLT